MGEWSAFDPCPAPGDLVLAYDAGVTPAEAARISAHLRRCARCREELDRANAFVEAEAELDIDEAYADERGARYDSEEKQARRFAEFQNRLHRQKQDQIHRAVTASRVRRFVAAASIIVPLVVGLTLSRSQTVVRAEELLTRAEMHETTLPKDDRHRVRLQMTPVNPVLAPKGSMGGDGRRVAPFLTVRHLSRGGANAASGAVGAGAAGAAMVSGTSETRAVAQLLAEHHFDFDRPLSMAGVMAWRATLGVKHDEVVVAGDMLVLTTTTPEGLLREVTLTVRQSDYHVVALTLAFEGVGRSRPRKWRTRFNCRPLLLRQRPHRRRHRPR